MPQEYLEKKLNTKLISELKSFENLWEGGYFEGDPLNPMERSSYGQLGFMSILHATYLRCIRPYIKNYTVSLEIGPGWKRFLDKSTVTLKRGICFGCFTRRT